MGQRNLGSNLRHFLRAQIQGHHIIDRLEERGVEREEIAWRREAWKEEAPDDLP